MHEGAAGRAAGGTALCRVALLLCLVVALSFAEQEFGCPEGPPTAPLPPGSLNDVLARVDQIVARSYRHSIAVGVVYDQQLIHFTGSPSVTADSAFRIGSNSKVFTALLVWLAHQRGDLHLDDPVALHFPVFKTFRNRWTTGNRTITWRDLTSHRAGLARESPCQALWGECNLTLDQVLSIVSAWPAVNPIASRPSYSNLGFALAGHMAASVAGETDFVRLLQRTVLAPLNMTHTGCLSRSMSPPSYLVPGRESGQVVPNYDFGFENPAGGMYSTVTDMSRFAAMLFRDKAPQSASQLLDGTLVREWLAPVWVGAGPVPVMAYGAPWEMYLTAFAPGAWVRGKAGAVLGYTSQLALVPELKLGVVCLMGDGLAGDAKRVALDAIELLVPALTQLLQKVQPPPPLPSPSMVGIYDGAEDGFVNPPFLGSVNAAVSTVSDSLGNQRLFMNMLAQVGDGVAVAAQGYLNYSEEDSSAQTQFYRLVSQLPESCEAQTGGGSQFVTRDTASGTLRINGLYYGFMFTKRAA